jgi:phosphatidylserine/phosphatidylglycerophosphate/cardiolipin synthase-like enzyme
VDFVRAARPVNLQLISGRGHYEEVIGAVLGAELAVWIATANLKELLIEDHRAAPGRRRGGKRVYYRSMLAALEELCARGVDVRLLHAGVPSGPFARELRRRPALVAAMRACPRVHLKAVIVDGGFLYLGSANWTGAGLGAKGTGRRNFELGVVTRDEGLCDEVQAIFDRLWHGGECGACRRRDECGAPLDDYEARSAIIGSIRVARRAGR